MNIPLTIGELIKSNEWIWQAIIAFAAVASPIWSYFMYRRKSNELKKYMSVFVGNGNVVKVNQVEGDLTDKSSNKYEYKSHVEDASGTSVIAHAGGDIYINDNSKNALQVADIICLVNELVKAQLEAYTAQARYEAVMRNNDFNKTFESRLEEVEDKLNRFREPSMQFALREAASGYIKYGGGDKGEALVDLLIERVKVEEHTSKQSIIDEAIKLLPTLSNECIAVLAILSYTKLVVHRTKEDLDKYVRSMNPVLDLLPKVTNLDIQYLLQVNCLSPLHNYSVSRNLVIYSKRNYPLAFCRPIDVEHSAEFMRKYGIRMGKDGFVVEKTNRNNNEQLLKAGVLHQIFTFNSDGTITPLLLNMGIYKEVLNQKSYFKTIIPDVQKLLSSCELQSDQEIVSYYESLNPNWALAMRMLTDIPLNRYDLQPIGLYIGARKIFKLTGKEMPIEELL